jgi:hypothetical protein
MKGLKSILMGAAFLLAACSSLHTPLPLTDGPPPTPLSSSVYVGYGRAFRFAGGTWTGVPEYDYEFSVVERRFARHWEAVKEIHRLNPAYDGGAGPRDQTVYFMVRTSPAADGGLDLTVTGTLGSGKGHEKPGGGIVLEVVPVEKGWFVPFDTIRIRQSRRTENGRLEEVVELFSRRNGREVPFMKMQEEGVVYRPIVP